MRVDSPVYRAAATMTHRKTGSATVPILIGAISEVSQMAIALMITMKSPSVENSRRPVSATSTGRANRLTRTRTAAHDQEADGAGATQRHDRDVAVPAERERLADRDRAEEQDDDHEDDRVEHDLDDETTHLALLGDPGRHSGPAAVHSGGASGPLAFRTSSCARRCPCAVSVEWGAQ